MFISRIFPLIIFFPCMDNKQTHVLLYLISLTGKSVMFTFCEWLFQYCFLYGTFRTLWGNRGYTGITCWLTSNPCVTFITTWLIMTWIMTPDSVDLTWWDLVRSTKLTTGVPLSTPQQVCALDTFQASVQKEAKEELKWVLMCYH